MTNFNGKQIMLAGLKGDNGKSAYEIAVENGFEGTEEEWLASLSSKKPDKNFIRIKGQWFYYAPDVDKNSERIAVSFTCSNKKDKTKGEIRTYCFGTKYGNSLSTSDFLPRDVSNFTKLLNLITTIDEWHFGNPPSQLLPQGVTLDNLYKKWHVLGYIYYAEVSRDIGINDIFKIHNDAVFSYLDYRDRNKRLVGNHGQDEVVNARLMLKFIRGYKKEEFNTNPDDPTAKEYYWSGNMANQWIDLYITKVVNRTTNSSIILIKPIERIF